MLCGTRAISARSVGICDGVPSTARSSLQFIFDAKLYLVKWPMIGQSKMYWTAYQTFFFFVFRVMVGNAL